MNSSKSGKVIRKYPRVKGGGMATTVTQAQSSGSHSSTLEQLDDLSLLYALSKELSATLDADEIQRVVLRWVNGGVNGEVAALLLPDASMSQRSWKLLVNAFGVDAQAVGEQMRERLLLAMQAVTEQLDQASAIEIVFVETTRVERGVTHVDASKLRSFLSVPLIVGGGDDWNAWRWLASTGGIPCHAPKDPIHHC